jgi:hypothetical protein
MKITGDILDGIRRRGGRVLRNVPVLTSTSWNVPGEARVSPQEADPLLFQIFPSRQRPSEKQSRRDQR